MSVRHFTDLRKNLAPRQQAPGEPVEVVVSIISVGEPSPLGDLADKDPFPRHLNVFVTEHLLEEHPAWPEGDTVTHSVDIVVLRPAPILHVHILIPPPEAAGHWS